MLTNSAPVDHLVYGVGDLDEGVTSLAQRLGVRAEFGGKHYHRGTHNALADLGGGAYLELIAPDPDQHSSGGTRPLPFGVQPDMRPQLVGWAARTADIETSVATARAAGYDPGPVTEMRRQTPDGTPLQWRLTGPPPSVPGVLVPFLIDWAASPHPSQSAPTGLRLVELRAEHPTPETVARPLRAMQARLPLPQGPEPALIAALQTPNGHTELR